MYLRLCGAGIVVLALLASTTPGQEKKAAQTDKGPAANEVAGKIKAVDAKKKSFIVTLTDKSERTFLVNKDTKFTGPRGAEHEEGLSDPGMAKDNEVRVVPAADDKYAKEVKMAAAKGGAGKGKKKGG